jgi:hypothetical protein
MKTRELSLLCLEFGSGGLYGRVLRTDFGFELIFTSADGKKKCHDIPAVLLRNWQLDRIKN